MGMELIYILLVIIAIFVVLYTIMYFQRAKQVKAIAALDERKKELLAIPVADILFTLKNMNLTGQTKRLYESWQATWQTITNFQFPEIETALVSAEQYTERINYVKAKKAIDQAGDLIDEAELSITKVQDALQQILDSEQENRAEVDALQQRYVGLRNMLLTNGTTFGGAIETLEKSLSFIELDFTKFNTLTNDGDYMEAREVLRTIEMNIANLEDIVTRIPAMYEKVNDGYSDDIADLKDGYARLKKENFQFKDIDIPQEIEQVENQLAEIKTLIGKAELNEAQKNEEKLEKQIDHLYDVMETEIAAKTYVYKNQAQIQKRMDQILESNRYVLLEIDRISQNYHLSQNELTRANEFGDQLKKEKASLNFYDNALAHHQAVYTVVQKHYETVYQLLHDIDKEQSELVRNLSTLRQREKDVKEQLDLFELDMRNMKRALEKEHLPGLPELYLELFLATTARIEELSRLLNRVKIDMVEIDKLALLCQEDIENLDTETDKIIDSALLTEYMIQYANRYRNEHPNLDLTIRRAEALYNDSYKYDEAVALLETELERIEPGAAQRVRNIYSEEKNNRNF